MNPLTNRLHNVAVIGFNRLCALKTVYVNCASERADNQFAYIVTWLAADDINAAGHANDEKTCCPQKPLLSMTSKLVMILMTRGTQFHI